MQVTNLVGGSALVETDITFDNETVARAYGREFNQFGIRLRDGNILDLPVRQQKPARILREVASLDGQAGVSISNDVDDILILPSSTPDAVRLSTASANYLDSIGSIVGKLQALNSRNKLRIMIYDAVHDGAVRASVSNDQHELLRQLWDKDVIVEGTISGNRLPCVL